MGCTLEPLCAEKVAGEFLFPECANHVLSRTTGRTKQKVNAKKALVWLQGCLTTLRIFDLSVKDPLRYTLKTYRAGRATTLAAQGQTLAQIQLAGEWSSTSAPVSYMNTDIADRAQELNRMVHSELHYDVLEEPEEDGDETDPENDEHNRTLVMPQGTTSNQWLMSLKSCRSRR